MQRIYGSSRYLLTVSFLAYGAYANVALFTGGQATLDGKTDIMHGAVTAQIDKLYKNELPHRDVAIGLVGAARYLLIGEGREGVLAGADGWLFTKEEARLIGTDLDVTMRHVADVRARLAEQGTQLVILPVPAKSDVYADHAARPEMSAEMATLYDDFQSALANAGIASVDARAALNTERKTAPAFFATDTHWTQGGASAVADLLAQSGVIEAGAEDFAAVDAERNRFTGDLVSFVTSDGWAPMVGLAQEVARPYRAMPVAASSSALTAADIFAAPQTGGIVLIGTSYSADPRWSFAEALKLALGRDVLNYAQEGQGPARPMLAYLASADFADAPPDWVIWEIPVRYLPDQTIWETEPDTAGTAHGT